MNWLKYTPAVERIEPDETVLFGDIADTFRNMGRKVARKQGHAMRVSHAKATALLQGELTVAENLPAELAQGLFAKPGSYAVLSRFAQGPGEMLPDRISTHRGLALKVLGVAGEAILENEAPDTQDFVLEATGKTFINGTAGKFLANLRAGVSHAPSLSEGVKNAVSKTARATEAALEAVGGESATLSFFGHPSVHPLSEAYFSQVPLRWGDHVAKIGVYPSAATLAQIGEAKIDGSEDPDAFRTAMTQHFATRGATFELRVQLATDLDTTPIEDATVEWPEDVTAYRTVARLSFPAQVSWSEESHARFEPLSFRPSHSLAAHRPLGQVMRARLFVYGKLVEFRKGKGE